MTNRKQSLFLYEELLLLALRDKEGTAIQGPMYGYVFGGGIMSELLLSGKIEIDDKKPKSKLVNLVDKKPLGEPILDACISKIASAKRRASLQTWVQRFANDRRLFHKIADGLCDLGILKADQGKFLLIFSRRIYPEIDSRPEKEIIKRLHKAIFTNTKDIDARTAILLSLAHSGKMLHIPFDKKKLRERKARIAQIVSGELVGEATRKAIEAVQAAVMVACMVPVFAACT